MQISRLLSLLLLSLLSLPGIAADPPLRAAVSVPPLRTLMERIGGDRVRIQVLVPPGRSPHHFEPTPHQVAELSHARLYLDIGAPFEAAWLPRLRAASPALQVVDLRAGLHLRRHPGDHPPNHDDGHDSHLWTSPPLLRRMGATVRDALSGLDPVHGSEYQANYSAFARDMEALDRGIRERLAPVRQRSFLVYHPAWGHFADTYGFTQLAIEHQGKEPGARAMTELIGRARDEEVRLVLVQPQFDPKAAQQVARAIGGRVETLNPLSPDLAGTLRRLAQLLSESGK